MKTRVAIVRCPEYQPATVERAVAAAVDLLGGPGRFFAPGERVLLKPNLCSGRSPDEAATTHPEIIRAVFRLAQAAGAEPWVGENPVGMSGGKRTEAILAAAGVGELIRSGDIRWLHMERAGAVRVRERVGDVDLPLFLSRPAVELPVINLPKFKTHSLAVMTGAVKNLWGTLPGRSKRMYHVLAPEPDRFARVLAEVYGIVRPRLTMVDGVVGMEGEGPVGGRPRPIGVIIAGTDGVAVDAVITAMMNLAPEAVPTSRAAAAMGLGTIDLREIEIAGEPLSSLVMPDFLPAPVARYRPPLTRKMFEVAVLKVSVDPERCLPCQECVSHCPSGAVSLGATAAFINPALCRESLFCLEVCPQGAVRVERSQLYQMFESVIG